MYRQRGRLTRDAPGSLFAFWAAGSHDDFHVGPSSTSESWTFEEVVDQEQLILEVTSTLSVTSKYLFFEENPVCPTHWQDGFWYPIL